MARKKISFTLSERSIRRAIIAVETYDYELVKKMNELIRRLMGEGVKIAKANIKSMGAVYTETLMNSIEGYYSPKNRVALIRTDIVYAAYVEYGTGYMGKRAPHPEPNGWAYDVNHHGYEGWLYISNKDGKTRWTNGMPARPFMYWTARQLEEICGDVAREVFGA